MKEQGPGIAVVGIGALFPGAPDAPAFWRNITAGVDAIGDVPATRWDPAMYYDASAYDHPAELDRFYCRRGGFVDDLADFDPTAFGVMPSAVPGTEPDQLLALRATAEAIADAGGDDRLPDRSRIGVIVGRGGYLGPATARLDQQVRAAAQLVVTLRELLPELADDRFEAIRTALRARLGETATGSSTPESAIGLVPNIAASRVANRFDFHGPAYTVDAACASGLIAVELAVRELDSERCDAVFTGAVHHCHVATLWSVFTQLRALSPSQQIRPFDRRADGTLISEGTGMLLLKRLADAERAGDRVYAVIRGVGSASDGRATSLMSPSAEGQVLALGRAWRSAGLDPAAPHSVGLLEAHGTGTPAGDTVELSALASVFGPPGGEPGTAPVLGTVKSMIGHAMPAAGIAGLIKAVLAVHHGVLPPTLHAEEPHPGLAATRFRLIGQAEPWPEPHAGAGAAPRRAAVDAFGFGGINAHVVVEQSPGTSGAPAAGPVFGAARAGAGEGAEPMLLLQATSGQHLLGALDAHPEPGEAPGRGPYRLAIVDPTPQRLSLARKIVARGTPWRGRNDVWFTGRPLLGPGAGAEPPGRIALVFPGFEPEFSPRVDDVAEHFGIDMPALTGSSQVIDRAADIIAVGRVLAAALSRLGVAADVMAGHSLGEWTAMIAAGMFALPAVEGLIESLREGTLALPDVAYAALGCGAEQATAALQGPGGGGAVVLSHDNCPHQSVVCGPPDQVASFLEAMRRRGVLGQVMPFRSGFHTPMLAPFLGAARAAFDRLELHTPSVPVWSATSVGPFPDDPAAVRDLTLRHLLEPVRFRELTERLHEAGVRAFVQVGPGSLTGFVEDTLQSREHLSIAASSPRRSGLAQLRRVVAALWAEGAPVQTGQLPGGMPMAPAVPDHSIRLDLGSPLVHVGDLVEPLTVAPEGSAHPPAGPAAGPSAGRAHPVLAAFDAALRDATAAAHSVVDAWSATAEPSASGGKPHAPEDQSAVPLAPASSPSGVERQERVFSLQTMPDLIDHCLFPQPAGWPDPSDRFPVVPMTTLLEVMADAARSRFPGRTVVGLRQIRARRWLVVAPPATVTVEVHDQIDGEVRVVLVGYAEGTVRLAEGYPPAPEPAGWPLTASRPPEVSARALYEDGWMFHGPGFAGVAEVSAIGDDGIHGALVVLPAAGALLDSAGQLVGHWAQVCAPADRLVFPAAIEGVHLFGPPPRRGSLLGCAVRITSFTADTLRADVELRSPDGRVWARIDGWTCRRFATDDLVWAMKMRPETASVGEPQAGGWCLAQERWPDTASRELTMRRYLTATERAEYERCNPRVQRTWLLGRIAAKDAARHRLWQLGAGPIFPAELQVGNDEQGRPWICGPGGEPFAVSLAHTAGIGVAIVRSASAGGAGGVGIDVERVGAAGPPTESLALTPAERDLLDDLSGRGTDGGARAVWLTRFWTAKEAVGKAEGTGLAGRPRQFVVTAADGTSLTVTAPGCHVRYVQTRVVAAGSGDDCVVAWTAPGGSEGPDGDDPAEAGVEVTNPDVLSF